MQEILVMVEEKEYVKARDLLLKNNEVDIAEILEEILEELDVDAAIIMFRMLPKDVSVEVFSYLPSEDQVDIISGITEREISYIIEELDFDDKIDVLEELPANVVDKILEKTTKEERRLINTFLNYPENSAGSLMTPDYISLRDNMTVGEALAHIKKEGMDSETVYTCYVKEEGRKLEGIVSLRSLVIHDDNMKVSELMSTDYVYVNVYDDQEEVSEAFKKYGFLAIPVVDSEHRLVGIITVDDILDVIEEETTEDIERMAGVMDGSDTEYLDMGVFRHAKNRLPWLILLSVSLMITGSIIEQFEATLQQVVALTFYLPLLMGTGGNTGTQAATLIIRGLSLGDIELKDTLKVFWKEFRVSIILGIVLSAFNFAKIMLIDRESVQIAITVCASMMAVVIFAKLIGGMLPMLAKRLGIDPALMATPMISSLTDMVSSFVYLLMATAVLGISL
ncbi:magnesium transporter [Mogibacterium sp. BX12]|uniref:Magnesium transporter MgtE n=2 Tax=Zhenpiania hominis TaxID=2763644 RepID=A0A923NG77_9FIRM|nr:magnesium transporter [Zhenpiania hominis]MBC6678408.1 magnesium transporter [Zhenpiania hominis]